jgi:hypothetical protein
MELDTATLSLSSDVGARSVLTGNRLMIPAQVDYELFRQVYINEIEHADFTPEKAIYLAITSVGLPPLSLSRVLLQRVRY